MRAEQRVEVLGTVRAFVGDKLIEPRGVIGRSVLCRLAVEHGAVVSVDALVDAVWGDDPPGRPVASVRTAISRLRSAIGDEAITSHGSGSGYRLEADTVDVDLTFVEQALVEQALGSPVSELDTVERALDAWRGEPFDGAAATVALEPFRARVAELRTALVHQHRELLIAAGRADEAIALLDGDVAADPFRERTQLLLLEAFRRRGRRDDALGAAAAFRARLADATGLEPSAAFVAAEAALRDEHDDPKVMSAEPARLPRVPGPLFGRDRDVDRVRAELDTPGVVTLAGPGGVGKTRLAIEVGTRCPARVAYAALTEVDRDDDLAAAIGAAIGQHAVVEDVLGTLVERLDADDSLLVLDNCEHVLDGMAALLDELVARLPTLVVLATSRQPIGASNERVVRLSPLDVPLDTGDAAPAIRLFVERARRTGADLGDDPETLANVRAVCAALDGLPLAIELAAARVATIGLAELCARLPDDVDVLGSGRRGLERREATMEGIVEWSLRLLPNYDRQLFAELAVFPTRFTLAAVEHVTGRDDVAATLGRLVDASLVVPADAAHAEHYSLRLLEPVRAVAQRQLTGRDLEWLRPAHARWVVTLGHDIAARWTRNDARGAITLMRLYRTDLKVGLRELDRLGRVADVELLASQIVPPLTDHLDPALVEAMSSVCGRTTVAGEAAWTYLALIRGEYVAAVEHGLATQAAGANDRRELSAVMPMVFSLLLLGRFDEVAEHVDAALVGHELRPRDAASLVALRAVALHYGGDTDGARAFLERHDHLVNGCRTGGLVELTRADLAPDLDTAIDDCHLAIKAAREDGASMQHLLSESQLLLYYVNAGRVTEAARLALRIVPEELAAGPHPIAWTTTWYLAELFYRVGWFEDAALIIAAGRTSEMSMASGMFAQREAEMWAELVDRLGADAIARVELSATSRIARLWRDVEGALGRLLAERASERIN